MGRKVIDRMRALQGEFPTELRAEGGESDPAFSLHLSDLDTEPLLDAAAGEDKAGVRRVWLWEEFGVREGRLVPEKEIIWRGTRRTAEFVFGNVRNPRDLSDEQGRWTRPRTSEKLRRPSHCSSVLSDRSVILGLSRIMTGASPGGMTTAAVRPMPICGAAIPMPLAKGWTWPMRSMGSPAALVSPGAARP